MARPAQITPAAVPQPARDPARAEIAGVLRDQILSGRLRPGAPLSPADLANSLSASATPTREALIELALEGLVDSRPARGFAVRELSAEEVSDLYPVIWTLEGLALRTSPPSAETLAKLSGLNAQIRRAANPRRIWELDAQWHELLISRCKNHELRSSLMRLRQRVYRYEDAYFRHSGAMPVSVDQHAAIISALRKGAVARAIHLLEENWRTGPKFLVPWLERLTNPGTPPRLVRNLA